MQLLRQGQASEERNVVLPRHVFRSALSEDRAFVPALRASEAAHVFDDPHDADAQLDEHSETFLNIVERNPLRGCHQQDTIEVRALREAERQVSCAWWHVEQQQVEFSPVGAVEHLLQGAGDQGSAPNERLLRIEHRSHREGFDSEALFGDQQAFLVAARRGVEREHRHQRGTVEIGIQQSDAPMPLGLLALDVVPRLRERDGEVDRERRFADPPLAAGNAEHDLHPRHAALPTRLAGRRRGIRGRRGVFVARQHERERASLQMRLQGRAQARLQRSGKARERRRQRKHQRETILRQTQGTDSVFTQVSDNLARLPLVEGTGAQQTAQQAFQAGGGRPFGHRK